MGPSARPGETLMTTDDDHMSAEIDRERARLIGFAALMLLAFRCCVGRACRSSPSRCCCSM